MQLCTAHKLHLEFCCGSELLNSGILEFWAAWYQFRSYHEVLNCTSTEWQVHSPLLFNSARSQSSLEKFPNKTERKKFMRTLDLRILIQTATALDQSWYSSSWTLAQSNPKVGRYSCILLITGALNSVAGHNFSILEFWNSEPVG